MNYDMKKKLLKIASGLAIIVTATILPSCNPESLTDLGDSIDAVDELIPDYLFTSIVDSLSTGNNGSLQQGMQYTAYYKDVPDVGGKQYNPLGGPSFDAYTELLNRLQQLDAALTSPDDVNKKAINKIIKVWTLGPLTDELGDIPYSDANTGFEGNYGRSEEHTSELQSLLRNSSAVICLE